MLPVRKGEDMTQVVIGFLGTTPATLPKVVRQFRERGFAVYTDWGTVAGRVHLATMLLALAVKESRNRASALGVPRMRLWARRIRKVVRRLIPATGLPFARRFAPVVFFYATQGEDMWEKGMDLRGLARFIPLEFKMERADSTYLVLRLVWRAMMLINGVAQRLGDATLKTVVADLLDISNSIEHSRI